MHQDTLPAVTSAALCPFPMHIDTFTESAA